MNIFSHPEFWPRFPGNRCHVNTVKQVWKECEGKPVSLTFSLSLTTRSYKDLDAEKKWSVDISIVLLKVVPLDSSLWRIFIAEEHQ